MCVAYRIVVSCARRNASRSPRAMTSRSVVTSSSSRTRTATEDRAAAARAAAARRRRGTCASADRRRARAPARRAARHRRRAGARAARSTVRSTSSGNCPPMNETSCTSDVSLKAGRPSTRTAASAHMWRPATPRAASSCPSRWRRRADSARRPAPRDRARAAPAARRRRRSRGRVRRWRGRHSCYVYPVLNGKQRRYLRALGHHRDPVVQVGKEGISEGLVSALDVALETHELVKVKLGETAGADRRAARRRRRRSGGGELCRCSGARCSSTGGARATRDHAADCSVRKWPAARRASALDVAGMEAATERNVVSRGRQPRPPLRRALRRRRDLDGDLLPPRLPGEDSAAQEHALLSPSGGGRGGGVSRVRALSARRRARGPARRRR